MLYYEINTAKLIRGDPQALNAGGRRNDRLFHRQNLAAARTSKVLQLFMYSGWRFVLNINNLLVIIS